MLMSDIVLMLPEPPKTFASVSCEVCGDTNLSGSKDKEGSTFCKSCGAIVNAYTGEKVFDIRDGREGRGLHLCMRDRYKNNSRIKYSYACPHCGHFEVKSADLLTKCGYCEGFFKTFKNSRTEKVFFDDVQFNTKKEIKIQNIVAELTEKIEENEAWDSLFKGFQETT